MTKAVAKSDVTTNVLALTPATSFALDFLRASCAQLVLLGHAFDFFNVFSFLGEPDPPPQIQRMAVVVFFLLSGFLIARSVARPSASYGAYLSSRARRIFSGLVPALIFIAVADALPFSLFDFDYPGSQNSFRVWLANLLQLQGYPGLGIPVFGSADPLWTLSIEWWLYMGYGGAALGLWRGFTARRNHQPLPATTLISAIVALSVALPMIVHNLIGGPGRGLATVWFLGAGSFGILQLQTSKTTDGRHFSGRAMLALVSGLGFLSLALFRVYLFAPDNGYKAFDRSFTLLLAIAFFFLLLSGQQTTAAVPRLGQRVVLLFANYSYTLYLTHFTVLTLLYELRGVFDDRLLLVVSLLLSNAVAWLLARFGEARGVTSRSAA